MGTYPRTARKHSLRQSLFERPLAPAPCPLQNDLKKSMALFQLYYIEHELNNMKKAWDGG